MATIAERLEALLPNVALLRGASDERSTIQALRSRLDQVVQLRHALNAQVGHLQRIEHLGGKVDRPRLTAALREKPTDIKRRIEANPGAAVDSALWDTTFKSQVETFGAKVQQASLTAWQSLVDLKAPPVADEVLKQFERTGFGHAVQEIRTAREAIRVLRSRLPRDEGDLAAVSQQAEAVARELATLKAVPDGVRVFFSKAATHEAMLDDLTSDVVEWLRDKDMLRLLRIGFR